MRRERETEAARRRRVAEAEARVIRAAERFEADWESFLPDSYDAAMSVVRAVWRLQTARKRSRPKGTAAEARRARRVKP